MVKLKKGPTIHGTLQNVIIATINDPNYSFSLPKLADWESIVVSSADEKERMEFVGDAVMHLSVALYLYRLFPDATPGLYTIIRSAVNSNATFTHLMVKAGAFELPSQSHSTKIAADSFEVIVAALYFERGFADVCTWVQEQYGPLIAAARKSYDEFRTTTTTNRYIPFFSTKRCMGAPNPASTPLLKKIRMSSARNSPRSTLMAQRVINRMKSKGKVKLCFPTRVSRPPFATRLRNSELRTPEPERPPLVIDLTSDSESDEAAASSSSRVSQARVRPHDLCQILHPPPEPDISPQSDQSSYKYTGVDWPPKQGSITSETLSRPSPESMSSLASSSIPTPPDHITSNVPQADIESSSRPGLSLPLQLNNTHITSGTHEDPIVIEDSEPED